MEEKKVIHSTAEKELMSLAHDILRNRKRMSIADIKEKAETIISIISSTNEENIIDVSVEKETMSALEKALQKPVEEARFETIEISFADSLFEGNNVDFQRVVSMLRSKENAKEAATFIENQIQPDYDWSAKQKEVAAFYDHIASFYDQQH